MAELTAAFNNAVVALHRLHTIEEIFLFSFTDCWAIFIDGSGLDPTKTNRRRFKKTAVGVRRDHADSGWRLVSQHFTVKAEAEAAMAELLTRLQELGVIELAGKADPSVVVNCQ